jgi:hypothetical protein
MYDLLMIAVRAAFLGAIITMSLVLVIGLLFIGTTDVKLWPPFILSVIHLIGGVAAGMYCGINIGRKEKNHE